MPIHSITQPRPPRSSINKATSDNQVLQKLLSPTPRVTQFPGQWSSRTISSLPSRQKNSESVTQSPEVGFPAGLSAFSTS